MKKLFAKFVEHRFYDKVNGKPVNLYECKDGTRFLSYSRLHAIFFNVKLV